VLRRKGTFPRSQVVFLGRKRKKSVNQKNEANTKGSGEKMIETIKKMDGRQNEEKTPRGGGNTFE